MADPGFPGQHTTTTTVQTSSTTVATTMRFDNSYIRTVPGILKIIQLFLNAIGSGCIIRSRGYYSEQSEYDRGNFFICVALFAFWFTGVLFVFYLFHITEKFNKIPWLKIEFGFCAIWTGFYLIASSLVVALRAKVFIAAGALNLLGFICIECSGHYALHTRGSFFNFVSMFAFWFTGILFGFYLFHIIEKFYKIPWLKIEFVFCAIWTGFYLIASSLAVALGVEAFIAAGFFGFCAMIAYGIDAFFKFQGIKTGQLAQGERVINKQTTTMSSPTY